MRLLTISLAVLGSLYISTTSHADPSVPVPAAKPPQPATLPAAAPEAAAPAATSVAAAPGTAAPAASPAPVATLTVGQMYDRYSAVVSLLNEKLACRLVSPTPDGGVRFYLFLAQELVDLLCKGKHQEAADRVFHVDDSKKGNPFSDLLRSDLGANLVRAFQKIERKSWDDLEAFFSGISPTLKAKLQPLELAARFVGAWNEVEKFLKTPKTDSIPYLRVTLYPDHTRSVVDFSPPLAVVEAENKKNDDIVKLVAANPVINQYGSQLTDSLIKLGGKYFPLIAKLNKDSAELEELLKPYNDQLCAQEAEVQRLAAAVEKLEAELKAAQEGFEQASRLPVNTTANRNRNQPIINEAQQKVTEIEANLQELKLKLQEAQASVEQTKTNKPPESTKLVAEIEQENAEKSKLESTVEWAMVNAFGNVLAPAVTKFLEELEPITREYEQALEQFGRGLLG
ncbi:MAG: hypothetical protein LBC25_02195 [Holosporales bacterium]|jgi:hypothetical protein|nr:hypothetical protein [Holosporales bacterium]